MACSTGTPARDHNMQLLNGIFNLKRQEKLAGGGVLPLCFTGGSRGRENGLSQATAKGCNQSGGQIQTRAKCLQCGPDGLVALAPDRLCLQLEGVTQDRCAGQSVREIPPEGESFLSLPSHPTPLPEMGSSSSTFTCKRRRWIPPSTFSWGYI